MNLENYGSKLVGSLVSGFKMHRNFASKKLEIKNQKRSQT